MGLREGLHRVQTCLLVQLLARQLKDNSPSRRFPIVAPFLVPAAKASFLTPINFLPLCKTCVGTSTTDCANTLIITWTSVSFFLCFYTINVLNTLWAPEQTHKAPPVHLPQQRAFSTYVQDIGMAPRCASPSGCVGVISEPACISPQPGSASPHVSFTWVRQTSSNVSDQYLAPHVRPMDLPPPRPAQVATRHL